MNDSGYLMFDQYKMDNLRWQGHLVMFVPSHSRDVTGITQ
jgi:hypothetical protein